MIFDRRLLFVGTFNIDPRSMFINTEIGLLIDSPELAEDVRRMVDVDFRAENAWRVVQDDDGRLQWAGHDRTLNREPAASAWRRFQAWLLGLFPMDNQL
jgi:putative cardiolipin synthase